MYCMSLLAVIVTSADMLFTNWRAGASQPSRTTGNDFSIYIHWDGAHFTSAHARKFRETPTRHLYPLPFAIIIANQSRRGVRHGPV